MLNIEITSITAAVFGLFYLFLSFRVIQLRRRYRVGIGHSNIKELDYAIRGHGNFSEYAPIAIILLLINEISGSSTSWLWCASGLLVAGRVIHGIKFAYWPEGGLIVRQIGMMATFFSILILSLLLLS